MRSLILLSALVVTATNASDCPDDTTMRGMRCLSSEELTRVEAQVSKQLETTVAYVRADPLLRGTTAEEALMRSQKSWRAYVQDACLLEGLNAVGATQPQLGFFSINCLVLRHELRLKELAAAAQHP